MSAVESLKRSAPFSTHARGVPLFNPKRFWDLPRHVARLLLDLRDISSSTFWFLGCQSWLTFWAALNTLCSVTFFTYFGSEYVLASSLDWSLVCFVVVLPVVLYGWAAYCRREKALDELSRAKVLMMSLYTSHQDWAPMDKENSNHMLAVRSSIAALLEAMHDYFMASRFYTRFYPYFGFRSSMVNIALDRARHVRRVGQALQTLSAANVALGVAGLAPTLEAQLHDRVFHLQLSLDKLANVKEFRLPQGVRSMARFYMCLFIPIFYGPYWAWVSQSLGFAFSFFFSILLSIALLGVLNVALSLEDPFDNYGFDGIYIDEALFEVEQLLVGGGGLAAPAPVPAEDLQQPGSDSGSDAGLRASAPAVLPAQQQQQQRVQATRVSPPQAETV